MEDRFTRTRFLFGDDFELFSDKKVIIFGVGGVGGFALDCLYRVGIGNITIVDKDFFDVTNQNRQIGSHQIGKVKVHVLAEMYHGVIPLQEKVDENFIKNHDLDQYDYVVDAIDDIPAKVLLAKRCEKMRYGTYISSTGSAKKLNPLMIKVDNIWNSYGDRFGRKMRDELKKSGFKGRFKVVFSPEEPKCKQLGSFSAVTASFGLQIGSEIVRDIITRR
ncbi:ThiF family adenylyltransferase [Helicobacter sp. faydin-H20]|uniref:ThiF family adenylyltransferase n=1 Tax=Helicobacter anatolicus TaxID=2905874 RepID=UPI001E4C89E2|nr:ThiF family adenylyltransferase [Helicobacter anatolicus]MCE3036342.1 ThiF family adenylyltransferase [Helicobacter anatolicus]